MKRYIQALVGIAAVVGLATSAHAGFSATDGFTTNNWQGAPNYFNYGASGAINKNPGGAFVGEGNYGATGGSGGLGGLANAVPITQAGMLNSIQLVLSGGVGTYNLAIYDLGLTSAFTPTMASSSTFNPGSVTLVKFYGGLSYTGANGGAQSVTKIDFTGSDQVWLNAGEEYAFAIEPTSTGFFVARGGADTFASDMLFRMNQFTAAPGQYGAINGSGAPFRHAAIAITVPEPASVALLGIGALVSTFVFRRKV